MAESLFSIADLSGAKDEKVIDTSGVATNKEPNQVALGKAKASLEAVIGDVTKQLNLHYASKGRWSSHDLLFHILDCVGPASVYFSTWSISETAVRSMIDRIDQGSITSLYCLLDWRVKVRRPEALQLALNTVTDARLTTCHAKVTVVENANHCISVVGSANYTNNPRIEAGVICADAAVGSFHKSWIMDEINNAHPFDDE